MIDAEHRMKLPNTTGFCSKCRDHLQKMAINEVTKASIEEARSGKLRDVVTVDTHLKRM